jgi:tRNA pseudouridine55 synthase
MLGLGIREPMLARSTNFNDDGIVIIDKPENMSSAKVVARVKAALGAKKVGHTGTLDPFATGILICCINRATRLARFFLEGDKSYGATIRLGIETDTQDATGAVISENHVADIEEKHLADVFQRFQGWIDQIPPAYSALKHKGVPLYKLARQGKPMNKPARKVHISSLRILEIEHPCVRFEVHCSTGTYVRTLCADIGAALGCGGHLKTLQRTCSSRFVLKDALPLPEFERITKQGDVSPHVITMADALSDMQTVMADNGLTAKVAHGIILTGKDVAREENGNQGNYVKIVNRRDDLLAVVQRKKGSKNYDYCCVFKE